ncbi:hypothetical protein WAI453_002137 [Rhynchosporium graminicola]
MSVLHQTQGSRQNSTLQTRTSGQYLFKWNKWAVWPCSGNIKAPKLLQVRTPHTKTELPRWLLGDGICY